MTGEPTTETRRDDAEGCKRNCFADCGDCLFFDFHGADIVPCRPILYRFRRLRGARS